MNAARASLSIVLVALIAIATAARAQPSAASRPTGPERWEAEIAKFEAADRERMPAPGGVVFVGSSTIRGWDVDKWFGDLPAPVIGRGFGGSQMADAAHFVRRIVTKHRPRVVVLYEGDNDIFLGKSPEEVASDLDRFATALHDEVPEAKLIVLAIKPSGSRWDKYETMRQANELFRSYAATRDWITVIDMAPLMLDESGRPKDELFKEDRLPER